jgi:ferredoxin
MDAKESKMPNATLGSFLWIEKTELQAIVDELRSRGYRTILPRIADGAVVLDDGDDASRLPIGWIDRQDGGTYRLRRDERAGWFDYVVGPHSIKKYLFPPVETVLTGERVDGNWRFAAPPIAAEPIAVVGARSCDLHAIAVQDRVFLDGPYVDEAYKSRREKLFLVAVNCRRAAATCFCHSMDTGPAVRGGFDLALTELDDRFIVEVGTAAGAEIIAACSTTPCTDEEIAAARDLPVRLRQKMDAGKRGFAMDDADDGAGDESIRARAMNVDGIRDLLVGNLEHARWDEVAERCLSCANCTMVCPTCFCSSVDDVADLTDENVRREKSWASCFTAEHSYMSSGVVRQTTRSRYRQWLVHKLATWHDQFDVSGCVGCGRCITWCPVGIDLTEEVAAIRGEPS